MRKHLGWRVEGDLLSSGRYRLYLSYQGACELGSPANSRKQKVDTEMEAPGCLLAEAEAL